MRIVKPKNERVDIYGFYDICTKRFVYVGQSFSHFYRRKAHSHTKPELSLPNIEMKVLRQTNSIDAARIELQIILNLKRKGQCLMNKAVFAMRSPRQVTNPVYASNGMAFTGKAQAARHFGISVSTINNRLKDKYPVERNIYITMESPNTPSGLERRRKLMEKINDLRARRIALEKKVNAQKPSSKRKEGKTK